MTKRKLSAEQVRTIRERLAVEPGLTYQQLANEYGVVIAVIASVAAGRSYPEVGGPLRKRQGALVVTSRGGYARHELRRFTDQQVIAIREEYCGDPGATFAAIGRAYGCNALTIRNIVMGVIYENVGGPRATSRFAPGSHPKIEARQVIAIREEYASDPRATFAGLARRYKVTSATVRAIVMGLTHANVGGPRSVSRFGPGSKWRNA